jgi:hypothetical protein
MNNHIMSVATRNATASEIITEKFSIELAREAALIRAKREHKQSEVKTIALRKAALAAVPAIRTAEDIAAAIRAARAAKLLKQKIRSSGRKAAV